MNGARTELITFIRVAVRDTTSRATGDWRRLTLAAALGVTVLDAVLLQRKVGLFTGGFLAGNQLRTAADGAAFLLMAVVINATIAAPMTWLALVLGRLIRTPRRALQFATLAAGFVPMAIADFITYQMWSYLGSTFDFQLMFALTGRRVSEIAAVAAPLFARPAVMFGLTLVAVSAAVAIIQRIERGSTAPPLDVPTLGTALQRIAFLAIFSSAAVIIVSLSSQSLGFGLRWTPSGQLFTAALNGISDLDHDGYGLLKNPLDTSPLDSRIHPYAVEIPGNGIDENGLAGDLPLDRAPYRESAAPIGVGTNRPPVVLFVLESFRADSVGASLGGRAVTPVLDSLARDGLKVENAWSHNGFTTQSRRHILTGSLVGESGGTSLLDDFKRQGYDVGYFSGQDDAFGDNMVSHQSVDRYYDAREDLQKRYTTYTTPGSLAVPLRVVETRIGEYLTSRDGSKPLFLYVNFHDTHYPYSHEGLENLLGVNNLSPSQIAPGRRSELRRTYLNTAANVDAAIGRVISSVERTTGRRPAVVVIGDHGESLFEGGFLGHGFALNEPQTRIPLIIRGLPAKIRIPFGQADLRDTLVSALAQQDVHAPPTVQRRYGGRVFQYLGRLETPGEIGWLTADGRFTYDFRTDRVMLWDTMIDRERLSGEPRRMFEELIHTWESMQLALSRAHQSPN